MSEKSKYRNVVRAIGDRPWPILESTFRAICDLVALRASGEELTREQIEARIAAGPGNGSPDVVKGIAVLPLYGVITPRATLFSDISGGTSVEGFRTLFMNAVDDRDVSAILLDVNSPGGAVDLVPELAGAIREARGSKPIVAVANTLMASAAYWIASQADSVYGTTSGDIGSIGVFAMHEDWSKAMDAEGIDVTLISAGRHKTDGNPYEPLADDARKAMQDRVDDAYNLFVADVAAGRGVSEDSVRKGYGEGRVLDARRALSAGLIDGIQEYEATLTSLIRGGTGRAEKTARKVEVEIVGEAGAALRPFAGGKTFVDEAEDARVAVASLVTRMQALRELREGRLTATKREQLERLSGELVSLADAIEEALEATAPEQTPEDEEHHLDTEAALATAEARLRLSA